MCAYLVNGPEKLENANKVRNFCSLTKETLEAKNYLWAEVLLKFFDLGSLCYVPIDKWAISRRYLRYSLTSTSARWRSNARDGGCWLNRVGLKKSSRFNNRNTKTDFFTIKTGMSNLEVILLCFP